MHTIPDIKKINNAKQQRATVLVLVVLYKCEISESETIQTLLKQGNTHTSDFKLIIWDNSPVSASIAQQSAMKAKIDFEYISCQENMALSRVYNKVVDTYNFDYILLLDQDTGLPDGYFNEIASHIQLYPKTRLFLPIVKNGDLIVSPGNFHYFKGKHWSAPRIGVIKSKNILAVTSGMLISQTYFEQHTTRFDERLSLYGIDSKFMLDYANHEGAIHVLPVTFKHNSALWSKPTADVLLPRFVNLKQAWTIILSDRPLASLLYSLYSKYLSIKLALRYSDKRFLH